MASCFCLNTGYDRDALTKVTMIMMLWVRITMPKPWTLRMMTMNENAIWRTMAHGLSTMFALQPRSGDKLLRIWVLCAQNGTAALAILKGLTTVGKYRETAWKPNDIPAKIATMTGHHSNQDPSYTQKPTYSSIFTCQSGSWLLDSPPVEAAVSSC